MAHTFSNKSRIPNMAGTTVTTNPVSGSYLPSAGDTVLVAMIASGTSTARTGGDPTFGGVTMLQAGSRRLGATSPEAATEMWYITGSMSSGSVSGSISGSWLSIPNTDGLAISVDIASAKAGTGTTSVLNTTSGSANTGATTNPYSTITTTAGNTIIFEHVATGAQSWNPTARTENFVQIWDRDNGSWGEGSQYLITNTIGVITGSWTFGTGEDWGVTIAAFGELAYISIQNANQSIFSDNIALTQNYLLTPQNTVHVLDTLPMSVIPSYISSGCAVRLMHYKRLRSD